MSLPLVTPIYLFSKISEGVPIVNGNDQNVGSAKLNDNYTFTIVLDDPAVSENIDINISGDDWIFDPKIGFVLRGEDGKYSFKLLMAFSNNPEILLTFDLSIRKLVKDKCNVKHRKEVARIKLEIPNLLE